MSRDLRNRILVGDVRQRLSEIPDGSVDCVITSPPYFQLRNYGWPEQIGLEGHVEDWVESLRAVLADIGRVLKPSGSVWLNLGDTHSSHPTAGARAKSLLLGPERLGLALIADGWLVRNKIVWAKRNPLPSGARDRLSCTWEVIYLLTRSPSYFFDLDAIRVPHSSNPRGRRGNGNAVYPPPGHGAPGWASEREGGNKGLAALRGRGLVGHPLGKNPGDVWQMSTASFRGAHFATFPKHLVERPLLATCPERVCATCGLPWQRDTKRALGQLAVRGELRQRCDCESRWQPGLVLDPFSDEPVLPRLSAFVSCNVPIRSGGAAGDVRRGLRLEQCRGDAEQVSAVTDSFAPWDWLRMLKRFDVYRLGRGAFSPLPTR